ncbi:hypothetical protein ACTPEF_23575, partial [Clostridioides difficile]
MLLDGKKEDKEYVMRLIREFGGTSLSQVGDRVIHMKGGISGQKVRAGVKKVRSKKAEVKM